MAKVEVFKLELDAKQYLNVASNLKKKIIELELVQKQLGKTSRGKTTPAFVENQTILKSLRSDYTNLEKAMIGLNKQQVSTAEKTSIVTKEFDKEAKTINEANQQITRLNKLKKDLDVTNKEEKKLLDDINKRIDSNTDFVKKNSSEIEKQKINIGNYVGVLDGVSPRLAGWIRQGQGVLKGLRAQKLALKGTTGGLKLFRLALISTGIGAIVVAFGALITFLTGTQKGMDKVTRVLAPLKIIFQSFVGVIERVGEAMFNAFSNPQEAVEKLWESIKTNIVNRVTAIGGVFKALGKIISSGFTEGFEEFNEETMQLLTGVEDFVDKVKKSANDTKAFFKEAVERGGKIADLSIEISKQESQISKKRETNLNLIREQELITKDQTKSQSQINDALKEAERLTKENLNNENEIINLKVSKLKLEHQSNDTNRDELKELNELEAELEVNKGKARSIELRFLGAKNRLSKENHAKNLARIKEIEAENKKQLDISVENLNIELELFKETNKLKFESDEELNDEFVKSKIKFLEDINALELSNLQFRFANGLIKQNQFDLQKLQLENDFNIQKSELNKEFLQQEEQEKQKQLENDRSARQVEFELQVEENKLKRQTEFEFKLEDEDLQFENEQAILQDRFDTEEISKEEFNRRKELNEKNHLKKIEEITKVNSTALEKIELDRNKNKVELAQKSLGAITGLLSAFGVESKGLSFALATVDVALGIQKAYLSQLVAGDPTSIPRAILAAQQAGIFGAVNLATIAGTTFEKGGLQEIGGKRHSQGGTKFVGEDGTAFEAERGELIGVMSRQASEKFMAFNNMYTDGNGTSGVFQNGGTISLPSSIQNVTRDDTSIKFAQILSEQINSIKVVNNVNDTAELIQDNIEVQNLANI